MRFSFRCAQALSTEHTIERMVIPTNNAMAKKRLPITVIRRWLEIPCRGPTSPKSDCVQYDVAHIEAIILAGRQSIGTRRESASIVNLLLVGRLAAHDEKGRVPIRDGRKTRSSAPQPTLKGGRWPRSGTRHSANIQSSGDLTMRRNHTDRLRRSPRELDTAVLRPDNVAPLTHCPEYGRC